MPIPIIVCADDYGLSPAVSAGIRTLIERSRLSAASCMTASPHWQRQGEALMDLTGAADLGLHLTLSDAVPLGLMPRLAPRGTLPGLPRLAMAAYATALSSVELTGEIHRQINAFERVMGRAPAFVDGHHHVHQLPGIRDALLNVLRDRYGSSGPWLRICDEPLGAILGRGVAPLRATLISLMGRPLRRAAEATGVVSNRRFAGVVSFRPGRSYRDVFRRLLRRAPRGLLIMCHPGHVDAELAAVDTVVDWRQAEFDYLASEEYLQDVAAAGCVLSRFREACAPGKSSGSD